MRGSGTAVVMGRLAPVAEAAGGLSRQEFRAMYDAHGPAVFGLALRVLRDREQAEDVAQEIFLRMWQRPERYVPARGSLRSFLLADCHGRSIDRLRSERSRSTRERRNAFAAPDATADIAPQLVWQHELGGVLQRHLDALPTREAQAVSLAYFGGHTYAEVARLLGEAEGTIKSRIRTGLRRLREGLVATGEVTDDMDLGMMPAT